MALVKLTKDSFEIENFNGYLTLVYKPPKDVIIIPITNMNYNNLISVKPKYKKELEQIQDLFVSKIKTVKNLRSLFLKTHNDPEKFRDTMTKLGWKNKFSVVN